MNESVSLFNIGFSEILIFGRSASIYAVLPVIGAVVISLMGAIFAKLKKRDVNFAFRLNLLFGMGLALSMLYNKYLVFDRVILCFVFSLGLALIYFCYCVVALIFKRIFFIYHSGKFGRNAFFRFSLRWAVFMRAAVTGNHMTAFFPSLTAREAIAAAPIRRFFAIRILEALAFLILFHSLFLCFLKAYEKKKIYIPLFALLNFAVYYGGMALGANECNFLLFWRKKLCGIRFGCFTCDGCRFDYNINQKGKNKMKKSLISALLLVTMLVVTLTLCSFSGDVSCTSADEDMMYTLTAAAGTDYSVAESTVGDYNFFRVRVNPNTAVNIPLNLAIAGQTEQEEWSFDESSNEPVTSALSVTDLTASFDGSGNTTDGATINIPVSVEGTVYSFAFNFIISADVGAGLGERCTDTYRMVIEVEDSIDENRNLVYVINGYAENEAGDNILSADAGETITLAYSGPKNYEFSEWELRSEIPGFAFPEGSSETITFTMPDSDVVIEAQRNKLYDLIPVFDITDLTIPVLNATPDFDVTIPAGAHYHLARPQELVDYGYGDYVDTNHNGVWWFRQHAESDMKTTDTFNDATESYKFDFLLIPNSGYSFADNVVVTINGKSSLIGDYPYIDSEGSLYVISKDFSVTAPASDSKYTITSGGEITWTKGGTDGLLITSDAHRLIASWALRLTIH